MLYKKYWPNCFEELMSQYPQFYREVDEMVAILKAFGRWMDYAEADVERVCGDGFLQTADEETISNLEVFLNLTINRTVSLEERRKLLRLYFAGLTKLDEGLIKETLKSLTGADFEIEFKQYDEEGNHALYIVAPRPDIQIMNDEGVRQNILRRLPAHILVFCGIEYTYEDLEKFTYEELEQATYYEIEYAIPLGIAR